MIRSILQSSFYYYLIYDFYYEEPSVFMVFFSMWFEIVLVVFTYVLLKFIADGFGTLEYLGGIIFSSLPILGVLLLFAFMVPVNSLHPTSDAELYSLIKYLMIGVSINFAISIFYFLKNRGTESFYMANMFKKVLSITLIFLVSFFIVDNLPNPNNLIMVYSIVAVRFLIELRLTQTAFKGFKK